jgi:hypothetical protein
MHAYVRVIYFVVGRVTNSPLKPYQTSLEESERTRREGRKWEKKKKEKGRTYFPISVPPNA